MKNKKSKLAFSLIELSIVILVIGILVLGITKGSRIISEAKLKSARSLTKNSPVNLNANNLAFWLETTSEKSFSAVDAVSGVGVTNWYDINPSISGNSFDVTQSSSTSRPKYIANAINGLPTLQFDGSDDRMIRQNVSGTSLTKDGKQMTIFVVQKYYTPFHDSSIFFWGTVANDRIGLHAATSDGNIYFDFGPCCPAATRITFAAPSVGYLNKFSIISAVRKINNTGAVRINGASPSGSASSLLTNAVDNSLITDFHLSGGAPSGWGSPYNQRGDISEIIIFKTALTDQEIKDIEKYLSAKWGVALN